MNYPRFIRRPETAEAKSIHGICIPQIIKNEKNPNENVKYDHGMLSHILKDLFHPKSYNKLTVIASIDPG